jgi:hypothetical protein
LKFNCLRKALREIWYFCNQQRFQELDKFVIVQGMKYGRNTDGSFASGNAGKPKGSRNRATVAIESLLEGQAEALTQKAISAALTGDTVALKLCMDRIAPSPKDKPICFSLPDMRCARDTSEAAGGILRAVVNGDITPIEATRVMGLIDSYRRTLELTEIEHRLSALENADARV